MSAKLILISNYSNSYIVDCSGSNQKLYGLVIFVIVPAIWVVGKNILCSISIRNIKLEFLILVCEMFWLRKVIYFAVLVSVDCCFFFNTHLSPLYSI